MDIYRLHTATRNGGDVRHFEVADTRAKQHFIAAVTDAFISAGADHKNKDWLTFRACLEWWRSRKGEDEEHRITRVIGVHKLVDGEWEDMRPHFIEPQVIWYHTVDESDPSNFIGTREI